MGKMVRILEQKMHESNPQSSGVGDACSSLWLSIERSKLGNAAYPQTFWTLGSIGSMNEEL